MALTGGIATGKSHVLRRLAAHGLPVVDADVLAREAVAQGSPALDRIRERFGETVFAAGGSLDRAALAAVVFGDAAARRDLETIVHPEVYRRIRQWFADQRARHAAVAIADIPLLFETGREADFDTVIVAGCASPIQLRRLIERDMLSETEARARIAAQWPIEDKMARADHVVRTDGSFEETDRQVDALYRELVKPS